MTVAARETLEAGAPLASRLLAELCDECQEQLLRFDQHGEADSSSCAEILSRAAAGDGDALAMLLEISLPLIRRNCPSDLRARSDDLQQLVVLRLMRKLSNTESPFRVSTFAAYREYLNLTITSIAFQMRRREPVHQPLAELEEELLPALSQPGEADRVEARLMLERCLDLLPDPLWREVFRRRFMLDQDVAGTLRELQRRGMKVTRQEVYKAAEQSIRYLSRLPEVREMLES